MKRILTLSAVAIVIIMLDACKSATENTFSETKFTGIWRIDQLEVNGTILSYENIGTPKIEFRGNEYHWNTAGITEDGKFTLSDSTLTLDCTSDSLKPNAIFTVTKMDSSVIEYYSQTDNNRMTATLLRISK